MAAIIPAAVAVAKAAGLGAVTGGASYGAQRVLKKLVGKKKKRRRRRRDYE